MLTPFALFLGAAVLAAVLKSRPQEAAVPRFAHVPVSRSDHAPGWHPSVPLSERFESVTVLPYRPDQRAVKIVEVAGGRRELLYTEARQ